jgi:hypothetical protein
VDSSRLPVVVIVRAAPSQFHLRLVCNPAPGASVYVAAVGGATAPPRASTSALALWLMRGFDYGPGPRGRLRAHSVFHREAILHGAFIRARRALHSPTWRFPARAVVIALGALASVMGTTTALRDMLRHYGAGGS